MLPITGLSIVLRDEFVRLLFGYGQFDQAAVDADGGHAAVLHARPAGALADRGPCPGVLRRPGHADPGRGGDPRRRRQRDPRLRSRGPLGLPGLALAIAIGAWVESDRPGRPPRAIAARAGGPAVLSLGARIVRGVPRVAGRGGRRSRSRARARRRPVAVSGLLVRMVVVSVVWLLTSAGLAGRVADHGARRDASRLLDLVRRPARMTYAVSPTCCADPGRHPDRRRRRATRRAAWDAFVEARTPRLLSPADGWARVKAANGWTAHRIRARPPRRPTNGATGRRPAGGSARRSSSAGRGRCPWAIAYAPRGPVAAELERRGRSSHFTEAARDALRPRRPRLPSPDRSRDRARRSARSRRRDAPPPPSRRLAPAPTRSSRTHPDHRPRPPTRTPCGATSGRSGAST